MAVRVTVEPSPYLAEHPEPQLIPAGELVTTPEPVPALLTVRVCVIRSNRASTEELALIVKVQGLVPVQPAAEPIPF